MPYGRRAHEGVRQGSKMGNRRTLGARNRWYHSEAEAMYSMVLQWNEPLIAWEPQVRLSCMANGHLIETKVVDFQVGFPNEGRVELHDVKGYRHQEFKLRQKVFEATWLHEHPDVKYVEVAQAEARRLFLSLGLKLPIPIP